MRIQMVNGASNGWVAGDPSSDVRSFSKAFGAVWPIVRKVVPHNGPGWPAALLCDQGAQRTGLQFSVTRLFESVADYTAWLMSMHSVTPPHPWTGTAVIRIDHEDGVGYIEETAEDAVLICDGIQPSGDLGATLGYTLWHGVSSLTAIYDKLALTTPDGDLILTPDGKSLRTPNRVLTTF